MQKLHTLQEIIRDMGSVLVAYSGGVDSSLVAFVCNQVLGNMSLAVTALSPSLPYSESEAISRLAKEWGLKHQWISSAEMSDPHFTANSAQRCYYCKHDLFGQLTGLARERGLSWIATGANQDDADDYRPGHRAAQEWNVRAPLKEAGLNKDAVREISRHLGLPTWDKPAQACLASRIPYGTPITNENLRQVGEAEAFLHRHGFNAVRVRHHGTVARLEIPLDQMSHLWQEPLRTQIVENLHHLGFLHIALDLEGLISGSLNRALAGLDHPSVQEKT